MTKSKDGLFWISVMVIMAIGGLKLLVMCRNPGDCD